MKTLSLLSLVSLLAVVSCSSTKREFDAKREKLEKQEAHKMINESKDITIKRGLGDDKIILEDL